MLERRLDALSLSGERELVIDAAAVTAMDTAGAWLLHRTVHALQAQGRVSGLQGPAPGIFGPVPVDRFAHGLVRARAGHRASILARAGRQAWEVLLDSYGLLHFIGESAVAFARWIARPRRIRWLPILHNLQTAGFEALPITGLLTFLLGIVIAYQGAEQLQRFGANVYVADLVGLSMVRELSPLITAIIVAGRSRPPRRGGPGWPSRSGWRPSGIAGPCRPYVADRASVGCVKVFLFCPLGLEQPRSSAGVQNSAKDEYTSARSVNFCGSDRIAAVGRGPVAPLDDLAAIVEHRGAIALPPKSHGKELASTPYRTSRPVAGRRRAGGGSAGSDAAPLALHGRAPLARSRAAGQRRRDVGRPAVVPNRHAVARGCDAAVGRGRRPARRGAANLRAGARQRERPHIGGQRGHAPAGRRLFASAPSISPACRSTRANRCTTGPCGSGSTSSRCS